MKTSCCDLSEISVQYDIDITSPQKFVRIAYELIGIFREESLTRRDMLALMRALIDLTDHPDSKSEDLVFLHEVLFTWNEREWRKGNK